MGTEPTQHTPEQLKNIADRVEQVTGPAEDFRTAQARKTLANYQAAVDDRTRVIGPDEWAEWSGRLGVAVELLLDLVGEQGGGGQLDEIRRTVADLNANRAELLDVLHLANNALGVKVDEVERLKRIEDDCRGLREILGRARDDVHAAKEREQDVVGERLDRIEGAVGRIERLQRREVEILGMAIEQEAGKAGE